MSGVRGSDSVFTRIRKGTPLGAVPTCRHRGRYRAAPREAPVRSRPSLWPVCVANLGRTVLRTGIPASSPVLRGHLCGLPISPVTGTASPAWSSPGGAACPALLSAVKAARGPPRAHLSGPSSHFRALVTTLRLPEPPGETLLVIVSADQQPSSRL